MSQATVLFSAMFLCGITIKCGEAFGELIVYVIKQSYAIHKTKQELKELRKQRK